MNKGKAAFVEPMLCLAVAELPEGQEWQYELKLDGYRALGIKSGGKVQLRSRNNKDFALRYQAIARGLDRLPNETMVDGEVVAFDESGRPSFNRLQNYGSSTVPIFYYVFDLLMYSGRDVRSEPLEIRRQMLEAQVLSKLDEPIRYSPALESSLADLVRSVREEKLEGLIAKRRDSRYESGERSGVSRAFQK
jgi:ATP-dependent DNA ligase